MILKTAATFVAFPLLAGAMVLAFVRLLKGPTLADRIVAFDMIAASSVGIIVVTAIFTDISVFLDVASIWAIIAFFQEGDSWKDRREQIKEKNEEPADESQGYLPADVYIIDEII